MSLFELRSDPPALAPAAPRGGAQATADDRHGWRRVDSSWWTLAAIAVVAACGLAAVAGTAVVNGDGVWHLVWGRALADGTLETFRTGPTPHPSLLVLGAATSLLGDGTSYLVTYLLFGPLAFGALVAATFDVARRLSSRWAGAVAAVILASSGAVVGIAAAARYDIAFAALVMTAIALEVARPRRGVAPLACLAVAGLVRPEAWLLAGVYWLWLAPPLSWSARVRTAALVAVAPVLWMLMDVLVMGDPLYSLHVTDQGSEGLYRRYTPWENLEVAGRNLVLYLGLVPLLLLVPAAVLLVRDRSRAALPLVGALGVTLGIFLLLLAQGMASNERYLLVPACAFAILAAVAIDGGGRRTRRRVIGAVVLTVILSLQVASRDDIYATVANTSDVARERYLSAQALVGMPGVRAAIRSCPSVSLPSGSMRHWFAFHSGLSPESFSIDDKGRAGTALFIAPGSPETAKAALTRVRFDDDASFQLPPGLRPGPRNADWILYVAPDAACTSGLR